MKEIFLLMSKKFFRETARKFVEKEIKPNHGKWEKDGFVPKDLWLKAGEIGLLCPNVPKHYGGIGGDFRFNVVMIEEPSKCWSIRTRICGSF